MAKSLYEYCVEKKNDALLSQWHPEKNGDLKTAKLQVLWKNTSTDVQTRANSSPR